MPTRRYALAEDPHNPKMHASEIFRVAAGTIVRIDDIGLMLDGVTTLDAYLILRKFRSRWNVM
jgi:hypothetical protein